MNTTVQSNLQPDKRFIDVEKVIAGKSTRLLRYLPSFLIQYLKRILHQDTLNEALNKHADKQGLAFVSAILTEFGVNIIVNGEQHLLLSERFVVVSNHPLGGLDGMALMHAVGKIRPDIAIPANDFLLHLPNLRPLFIPVNKHGSNAENIVHFDDTFKSDKTVLYFPAGLCSRKIKGNIVDLEWKKTFLSKARKTNRDIIPVHISGRNSNFFYNLANFRKFFGIKANLEMFFLPHESITIKQRHITLTFGKPIPYESFDNSLTPKQWAAKVRSMVYELPNKNL